MKYSNSPQTRLVIEASLEDLISGTWQLPPREQVTERYPIEFATPYRGREVRTRTLLPIAIYQAPELKKHIGLSVVNSIAKLPDA